MAGIYDGILIGVAVCVGDNKRYSHVITGLFFDYIVSETQCRESLVASISDWVFRGSPADGDREADCR